MNPDNYSIKELQHQLKKIKVNKKIIELLKKDSRQGVQDLAKKYEKKILDKKKLKQKWNVMNEKQNKLNEQGFKLIAGVDEAGRGPLAGPVVAGAVIFDNEVEILELDDSKKLNKDKRERLFNEIDNKARSTGIGKVNNEKIDEINIHNASLLAMKKAIKDLSLKPDFLLIDGNKKVPGIDIKQEVVVEGDSRVNAIAAASILAKVTRDRIIDKYHNQYPEYNFKNNKGYGTREHLKALKKHGPSPVHRFSFSVVKKADSSLFQSSFM